MCPIRTMLSGLYRHRRDLGLHEVGYIRGNLHNRSPSLPSTPSRVQSGHGYSLRSSCLHSPSVRPMDNRPDTRGPLSPGLPHLARVSIGLPRLRGRTLLIHIGSTPRERPRPLRRRSLWIQDLLAEKNIETSSRRRPATLVSSLVDRVPCELYVSEDLAHV